MVGLFCFDGPLYKDVNGVYCNVTLTNEMFSRYFTIVDELVIAVRTYSLNCTFAEANMKPLDTTNMRVYECKNFNSLKGLINAHFFKKDIKNILADVDLVFARMPSTTSDIVTKICKKLKKDYLVEVGGCAWDAFWNHGFLGKIVAPFKYLAEKRNVKNAKFATYVTHSFLQRRYPNRENVEECSNVYIDEVPGDVLERRIQKINSSGKKFVFGQAVNSVNVKYKGEHIVIKLLSCLKKKGYDFSFEIVGPGDRTFLIKQAKKHGFSENVKFMGTLTKKEMLTWYDNLDIYIQPSRQEGLPRSVIEAMSRGVPCIGSNVAGIPELLDSRCLLKLSSYTQMKNVILNVISDKEFMCYLANSNFDLARKYYINVIEERRKLFFAKYRRYYDNRKRRSVYSN